MIIIIITVPAGGPDLPNTTGPDGAGDCQDKGRAQGPEGHE